MTEEHSERLSASVSPELKHKIRVAAAEQDKTMSEFVREILEDEFCGGGEGNPTSPTIATA